MNSRSISAMLLAAAIALPGWAIAAPTPYHAVYKVSAAGLDLGELEVSFALDGSHYSYDKKTHASGVMRWISDDNLGETSSGLWSETKGPAPQHYDFIHERSKGNKSEKINFSASKIVGTRNKTPYEIVPKEPLQDRASQELLLMTLAGQGVKTISIPVVEKGKITTNKYAVEGDETLHIRGKKFETLKLRVLHDKAGRETTVWLDKNTGFTPLRFSHKDGEGKPTVETVLESFQAR